MQEYKDDFIEIEHEAYKGNVSYDGNSKITIQLPLEPDEFDELLCLYNTEISINSEGLYKDKIYIERVKVNDVHYNWTKERGYEIIFDCEVVPVPEPVLINKSKISQQLKQTQKKG